MSSETTAAATGAVGKVRRDPMAMRPFIGYHAADYFSHWLELGEKHAGSLPKIFYVNWFRKSEDKKYLWPGFSENMRVLEWAFDRCANSIQANESPLGLLPKVEDLNLEGLSLSKNEMDELLNVDKDEWVSELKLQIEFLNMFGDKLPPKLKEEYQKLEKAVNNM
ncbi:UNVERIFIED_CONTAM: hypothetical protein GTU68_030685 [Idotea baltica]|nr:hypothetical protein [Idotea baltica]